MKIFRCYTLLIPLSLTLALTACRTASNSPLHQKTNTLNVPHVAGAALAVETRNGALTVRATDREDVEIIAVLRMQSVERLDATTVEIGRDDAGRLEAKVAWPENGRLNNEGCSFTIAIPDATGVELHSANGRITIAGLSGAANLRTSNGRIEVESHQGDVTAHTSNGKIVLHQTEGAIDVSSSNGRLEIVGATGPVKAQTSNGSMNIGYTEDGSGPVDVRSSNGSVALTVGAGFKGELQANSSNGRVSVEALSGVKTLSSGKHHAHLQFDESESNSNVRTSNGSIRIRKR